MGEHLREKLLLPFILAVYQVKITLLPFLPVGKIHLVRDRNSRYFQKVVKNFINGFTVGGLFDKSDNFF